MPPNNPAGYLDDDNAIPVDAQGNKTDKPTRVQPEKLGIQMSF